MSTSKPGICSQEQARAPSSSRGAQHLADPITDLDPPPQERHEALHGLWEAFQTVAEGEGCIQRTLRAEVQR
mgnify:CR=1 FL=1